MSKFIWVRGSGVQGSEVQRSTDAVVGGEKIERWGKMAGDKRGIFGFIRLAASRPG